MLFHILSRSPTKRVHHCLNGDGRTGCRPFRSHHVRTGQIPLPQANYEWKLRMERSHLFLVGKYVNHGASFIHLEDWCRDGRKAANVQKPTDEAAEAPKSRQPLFLSSRLQVSRMILASRYRSGPNRKIIHLASRCSILQPLRRAWATYLEPRATASCPGAFHSWRPPIQLDWSLQSRRFSTTE